MQITTKSSKAENEEKHKSRKSGTTPHERDPSNDETMPQAVKTTKAITQGRLLNLFGEPFFSICGLGCAGIKRVVSIWQCGQATFWPDISCGKAI
jgi:hypothetical protein